MNRPEPRMSSEAPPDRYGAVSPGEQRLHASRCGSSSSITDSDVDLFVILDPKGDSTRFRRPLSDAELLIGKRLDVVEYTVATANERTRSGNPFLSRVLAEPKKWLLGDAGILARLVAA